jgi:hypothetical protein
MAMLKEYLYEKQLPKEIQDTISRLLKYTPLGKDAYNFPKVASSRERLGRLAENFKVFDTFFQALLELGSKLEELDALLPRKFIATFPAPFTDELDTWFSDNLGRLFTSGGAAKQEELSGKMEAVKKKLRDMEALVASIPADLLAQIKAIALPEAECCA